MTFAFFFLLHFPNNLLQIYYLKKINSLFKTSLNLFLAAAPGMWGLSSQPGIEPVPFVAEVWNLNPGLTWISPKSYYF